MKITPELRALLKAALKEDRGRGDVTSQILIPEKSNGTAVIVAKQKGIFCGGSVAAEVFRSADPAIKIIFLMREGSRVHVGQIVARLSGRVRALVAAERTALNFLAHLSGIATQTRRFTDRVKDTGVSILDTRKTTPLWRVLEKYAVKTAGGLNHRMGLYDALFVKENHRRYGDLGKLRKYAGHFEIEVRDLKELSEALLLKPRVILLDNFTPARLKKAVLFARRARPSVILEASGGVTLANVRRIAHTGVNRISIGALTHSVPAFDFSMLIR